MLSIRKEGEGMGKLYAFVLKKDKLTLNRQPIPHFSSSYSYATSFLHLLTIFQT